MFSLDAFHKEYETDLDKLVINGRKFKILLPKDLHRFLNSDDIIQGFPLWAKVWPASWVLASHLAEMPVVAGKRFLEIGGGLGLVSIAATAFGHRMTMTEYNPDALAFARANALLNECPQLNIQELDWHLPRLSGQFDYIVASEVSYREEEIQPLLKLFKNSLKTDGIVILSGEMRAVTQKYYQALATVFDIQAAKKILRSDTEEIPIFLFRMTLK